MTVDVKQAGVLSPTLFAIYVDGLLQELQKSCYGCKVGAKYCGSIGYADDMMVLALTQTLLHI